MKINLTSVRPILAVDHFHPKFEQLHGPSRECFVSKNRGSHASSFCLLPSLTCFSQFSYPILHQPNVFTIRKSDERSCFSDEYTYSSAHPMHTSIATKPATTYDCLDNVETSSSGAILGACHRASFHRLFLKSFHFLQTVACAAKPVHSIE